MTNNSSSSISRRRALRYGLAFAAVAAGFGLRVALTAWIGPGLPTYITFYPAVMVVALLAGFGPGLLATALTGLATAYWILPPNGFLIASPVDRVGLVLFTGMGLFMSAVAELYRRDRRKAAAYDRETALRETRREKEFLANVLEHASQPFAVGYPDGRLGLCNRAYEQLTGYSAEELRAIDWATMLTPPEWRELERQKLEEIHLSGQPVRYEKEYVRKDGTRVPIELLVHLVNDAGGKPAYYYSFLTDITERKRAGEALRQSEERYRMMFDTMLEGFCIIEVLFDAADRPIDYRFLEINSAFEAQTGLRNAQGKRMRELAPEHEAHWFEIYGKVALTGEPARFVNEAKALKRWYDVSAYRVGGRDSRKVAILFSDITQRKQKESELRRLNRTLDALRHSSEAMMRTESEEAYLAQVCRIITDDCGHAMVWIGFAENDENKTICPAAHAGFEAGYLETLRLTWADTERGRGPTGMAIRIRKPDGCRNMLTDPRFTPWRDEAVKRGYASSLAVPLQTSSQVFGRHHHLCPPAGCLLGRRGQTAGGTGRRPGLWHHRHPDAAGARRSGTGAPSNRRAEPRGTGAARGGAHRRAARRVPLYARPDRNHPRPAGHHQPGGADHRR